jgi:hypothetical protein
MGHSVGDMAASIVGNHDPRLAGIALISAAAQNRESLTATAEQMAAEAIAGARVTEVHIATDPSYSDHRIALETAVIAGWTVCHPRGDPVSG